MFTLPNRFLTLCQNCCQVGVLFSNKTTPHFCHWWYWSGDKTQTPSYVVLQLSSLSACFPLHLSGWLTYSQPTLVNPLTCNTRFFQRSHCHCQNNGTLNERQMGVENIAFIFANFRKCKKKKSFGRGQLKCDGTRWRMGGEVKGKLANAVGSQYSSHYLGTRCIRHYYRWCAHLGCQ